MEACEVTSHIFEDKYPREHLFVTNVMDLLIGLNYYFTIHNRIFLSFSIDTISFVLLLEFHDELFFYVDNFVYIISPQKVPFFSRFSRKTKLYFSLQEGMKRRGNFHLIR